ncbi:FHA domain-containing protein [Actinokineospora sp. PR83]|uniref:FHA domain-containing protein n=1 Tax=Actinokineospora sp. PR83 TaxID=2884908 RepID=UPI0027E0F3C2|nr:FHA domain-containing protein [Actinokineospora sp. PR83]MCG8915218.1 FHA domain-containing protein [Actinokineospora sp. PR83]
MSRVCSEDSSEVFGDEVSLCPEHLCPLVEATVEVQVPSAPDPTPNRVPDRAGVPGPGTERRQAWSRDVCWHCGREAAAGNTRCANAVCGRALTPPALHMRFARGEVELSEGDRVELGRSGAHQRVFRDHPNVSRAHAVVRVDPDGSAWVEPLATPNGTFLNDVEIQPALSRRLASGDRVRFARDAEGSITLYER